MTEPLTPPELPLMMGGLEHIAGPFADLAEAAAKHRVSFTIRIEPEGFYINADDEAPQRMNTDHGDSAREHRDKASEGVDVPVHGVVIKRYSEGAFDEAAGDTVPADERVMDAVLDALFKTDGDEWRVVAEAVIAAAAPLIVADRDAQDAPRWGEALNQVVQLRAERDAALARIEAVERVHYPVSQGVADWCAQCAIPLPCPTIAALAGGGDDDKGER